MKERSPSCPLGVTSETLSAWRDQLLSEADAQRIALHVPDCASCQYRLSQFTRIATALQRQATPDLRTQTWRGIQARLAQKEHYPMRPRITAFNGLGIVAVVVLIGGLFAAVLSHRPGANPGPATGGTPPTSTSTSPLTPPPTNHVPTGTPPTATPSTSPTPNTTSCQFTRTQPPPTNVPLPFGTIVGGGNGASGEVVTQVCTPGGTESSIISFMASELPGAGWHQYNLSKDVNGGCADTFWTWANGHTALYWSFGNGYLGQGLPYWTIWTCGRINVG